MLGIEAALSVSNELDSRIVIPMNYAKPDKLEAFLKEAWNYSREGSSFAVRAKDLPQEGRKVVVLKP